MKSTKDHRRALVTGINGQDGFYMTELLISKGYEVFGLIKNKLEYTGLAQPSVNLLEGDLRDVDSLKNAVLVSCPDEVYNFAGVSDLATAFKFPEMTMEVNYRAVGQLIDAAVSANPAIKFLQASSVETFKKQPPPINEGSERDGSSSPYAEAKLAADRDFIIGNRQKRGFFTCSAILFNHESPRRPERFITRKITKTLAQIKRGLADCLLVGNLEAQRDWGFAGDYIEAMWRMLQLDRPEDFVIATGEPHSVKEFVELVAKTIDLDIRFHGQGLMAVGLNDLGQTIIKVDERFYRPNEEFTRFGDITKARKLLQWQPKTSFQELVFMMAKHDLEDVARY